MSVSFVLGISESAWTGLLTVTPVVLVAALLVWFYATVHSSGEK
ncbi:MAG: hypothetical protein QOJ71_2176 [Actinomycetota bacterium]|nr:hypothetical protein [Actinomycetota bacterium]